jgi:hypothetical protein
VYVRIQIYPRDNSSIHVPCLGLDFFIWNTVGLCLQVISTHRKQVHLLLLCEANPAAVILELRLWAMYGSTRKFALFFCLLSSLEVLGYGIIFSRHPTDLTRQ